MTMNVTVISTVLKDGVPVTASHAGAFFADHEGVEKGLVNLYPQVSFQTFYGFGGAFTEAAGYTLERMGERKTDEILRAYFGEGGLGYRFGRTHIDSCDFSLGNYSAVTDAADAGLDGFSLARDERYIIPVIQKANKMSAAPLSLMLTPWSPPAFMKTNGEKNNGGSLKPEYRSLWARYLCRYIKEYRKHGLEVSMFSPQNEPKAVQTWDSCVYTAAQERDFIVNFLCPEMERQGIEGIDLLIWDHNKERAFEWAQEIMDENAADLVAGVAFHWYSGDHFEALALIQKQFPSKRLVFSEACVEYCHFAGSGQLANAQMYGHDIIGNLNAGMDTFLDWNIVLDRQGGPNHVGNFCDAPILCDIENGTYTKNLSYDYIGHFSRYIRPGAVRIGLSRFTDRLELTAFRNTDGSIAVAALNRTQEEISFYLRLDGALCPVCSPAESMITVMIEQEREGESTPC